jgi:hypothetical protein
MFLMKSLWPAQQHKSRGEVVDQSQLHVEELVRCFVGRWRSALADQLRKYQPIQQASIGLAMITAKH